MTSLTFYGGVSEIGGTKIMLEEKGKKIFFDFGMSFGQRAKFFSEPFLKPQDVKGLLEFEILQAIEGVYGFDEKTDVCGVFISHAHLDHAAHITFLDRNIPVYLGEATLTIIKALNEIRPQTWENTLEGLRFKTFRTGDVVECGGIKVEPIHVDHSVPAAYAFIIRASAGNIIYTGDFRLHGTRPDLTEDFIVKAAASKPILMICEGTNAMGIHLSSEKEVEDKIRRLVSMTGGLVIVSFAINDIDRLRTLYQVAKATKRKLAISLKQAYLLDTLKSDPRIDIPDVQSDKHLFAYRRCKKTYYKWEQAIMAKMGEVLDAETVGENQSQYIMAATFYDLNELINIQPVADSIFILAAAEPFNEEMEIDYERLTAWMEHFGMPLYHVHVSGHILPQELKQVIKRINPKALIPIHTERPQFFKRYLGDVVPNIILPEKGEKIEIG